MDRSKRGERDLAPVKEVYEKWGREDPLYAVLTRKDRRGNRWDTDAFFARGREEVRDVLDYLEESSLAIRPKLALDFGCGVGRVTLALADHFENVIGVDIAESMVERASDFNPHGERVRYVVNSRPDLSLFDDDTFDFVYSNIVLQHIPPLTVESYVREFFRVLRPGGIALFQMPNGPRLTPGSMRARLYMFRRRTLRRIWKRLRGRVPYEMHRLARERMEEVISEAGGSLVDVRDLSGGRGRNFRYCAVVPSVVEVG